MERRIETSDMRFLRSGYSLRDRRRNTGLRQELEIYEIEDKLYEYQQQWKTHLERTTNTNREYTKA